MNFKIACVGKLKERYFTDAAGEYVRRLSRYAGMEIAEVPDEKAPETLSAAQQLQVLEREGERLLARIGAGEHVVALAIGGTRYTSEAFAARIQSLADSGSGILTFVIGGSLGLSPAVLARADETLSLSDMTMPHRIARIVLLEQLYRACKINRHEAYHK